LKQNAKFAFMGCTGSALTILSKRNLTKSHVTKIKYNQMGQRTNENIIVSGQENPSMDAKFCYRLITERDVPTHVQAGRNDARTSQRAE
jgi:hypothetical protein